MANSISSMMSDSFVKVKICSLNIIPKNKAPVTCNEQ